MKEKLLIANQDVIFIFLHIFKKFKKIQAFPETQEKIKNQIDILKQLNERKKLGKGFQSFRSDVVHEAQNMIECQSHELNQKILEKSVNVDLVVMNLPKYSEDEEDAKEFMEICEGMTKCRNIL